MSIIDVDKENRVSPKKISLLDPGNMTVTAKTEHRFGSFGKARRSSIFEVNLPTRPQVDGALLKSSLTVA